MKHLDTRRHFPLSVKLMVGVVGVVLLSVLSVGGTIYYFQSERLRTKATQDLEQAVQGMQQMISQSVAHAVRANLQAAVDRNLDIIRMIYARHKAGEMSEDEAKQMAADILLSQKIGESGYLYVVDSSGTLKVHPIGDLVGENISAHGFIQEQIQKKTGYLEYDWRNPGELRERPKSLAMSYFAPWDYIISANVYREESAAVLDIASFRDDVLALKFGDTGYAYVMDTKGTLLIHPKLEGENIFKAEDAAGRRFIAEMCRERNGHISYPWKNPGDTQPRYKDVVFRYFPDLDIIIAGGIYREELEAPLRALRFRLLLILLGALLVSIPAAYFTAKTFVTPVLRLSQLAKKIAEQDLRVVSEFDRMTRELKQGKTPLGRGSLEVLILLDAFRDAGLSIRKLFGLLGTKASKLAKQQRLIETAANYANDTVSDQTALVKQVASAMAEVREAFNETRGLTQKMHSTTEDAVTRIEDGRSAVSEAGYAMNVMWDRAEETRKEILNLGEVTDHIEGLVVLVQDIARHSQILSVNARIQAAKAGKAGRGFSVVASEVRDLALQSAESASRIRAAVHRIQETSMDAIVATTESSEAVSKGKESVARLSDVIGILNQTIQLNNRTAGDISEIIGQQGDVINRISEAVVTVEHASTKGAKTAEGLLQAVEELRETHADLTGLVAQYRV